MLLTLCSLFAAPALAQEPSPAADGAAAVTGSEAMTISGSTWVNARPASGTVRAFIGDTECASEESILFVDGAVPFFVATIPPENDLPGCGTDGATIRFTLNGQPAEPTVIWETGGSVNVQIFVGPPFAVYSGVFSSPVPFEELGNAMVEPLISGQVCGKQLNALQGVGPTWGFSVVVDPAELVRGCGQPGAHVQFRLVRMEDGRRTVLSAVTGDVVWEPGTHELQQVLAFQPAPAQELPPTGTGSTSTVQQWWRVALAIGAFGSLLILVGVHVGVRR